MEKYFRQEIEIKEGSLSFKCFVNSTRLFSDRRINVHPHWHEMTEVLLVEKGRARQHLSGGAFDISEGDIVLIRPDEIHGTYSGDDADILVLQFWRTLLNEKEASLGALYRQFAENTALPGPVRYMSGHWEKLEPILRDISKAYQEKNTGWELEIISGYCSILTYCIRHFPAETAGKPNISHMDESIIKVIGFVEKNFNRDIGLSDAVKLTNYSTPHFCRIFTAHMGMGFCAYLNRYRVNCAAAMLAEDTSVSETAQLCGFSGINSFIRTFGNIMGCSPGRYKKKIFMIKTKAEF